MRKRYVAATLAASVIIVGGVWLTLGVLTAPEWAPGQSWTYRVDDGEARWNVTFQVVERTNATAGDAWRVLESHAKPDGEHAVVRFFLVDTLNEALEACTSGMENACGGVDALFDYPVVAGESWEWERHDTERSRVDSHASVWNGEGTITHRYADGSRLEFALRDEAPFFTERTHARPDGSVENWWLVAS